ncbi:GNAT family N-acetyltransferase [Sphingobacterium oryzagri]|uniref:GNAT family N-acetyltransferase n=1 Tax=Sphingobacterium oryzagri TaxID=3025669 RepID=A0ABY7WJI6_9SPHI|nr:GNAT family N-acetyltransferase [Sphingobacterium sp. KACC 22765]WDF68742.1 GNAT family N-acetyltransferase [Sphingobacterium sp. KACC 22765]
MHIVLANENDRPIIEALAQRSWRAGYVDVLSAQQIDFMLNKSYSQAGLLEAMQQGQVFYLGFAEDKPVGFIALQKQTSTVLRIEKLYLIPTVQGKGYGRDFIDFALAQAREAQIALLELNVNRKNKAYYFYLKQGFEVVKEVDIPYHGFVLDDYVMQKPI